MAMLPGPVASGGMISWQSYQEHGRLARCQFTVSGRGSKVDLQLLYQCGSTYHSLGRSVPGIH